MTTQNVSLPNTVYRVSVKGLIWQGDGLLLVQEYTHWTLPGGGVDHGEEIQAGLRREIGEELQIAGSMTVATTPSHIGFGTGPRSDLPGAVPHCFVCYDIKASGEIKAGSHVKKIGFFTAADITDDMLGEAECDMIKTIIHEHRS